VVLVGKKVLAINSSKRKKNTFNLLKQLKEQLHIKNIEVNIINLFDFDIKECLGCEKCLRKGNCHIEDDGTRLMEMMKNYDGIILSTPVYMGNISGKLKNFVDRTCKCCFK